MIQFDNLAEQSAKIKVVGVGGAGGNALNGMIQAGLSGVEFISVNTDAQNLENNRAPSRIQIGKNLTKGLGAGANPEVGLRAAEEDKEALINNLSGADMVFITCGMGGGTGTGAAPVVAEIAKDLGALTVGIVTKPFAFEGQTRLKNAEKGIEEMRKCIDTLIVIPNDRVFSLIERNTSAISAFKVIDSILLEATRSISDLINNHGYINLDFADIRTVMQGMGDALMGTGVATGEGRAEAAAEEAISSPLLDGVNINGALGVLINITGGSNLTLWEVNDAASIIQEAAGEKVNVIFGMVSDEAISDELRVTVIATGFNKEAKIKTQMEAPKPVKRPFESIDFSELDKPTFIRRQNSENQSSRIIPTATKPQKTNVYTFEEDDIPEKPDELDTPTFLRKQMD
ncbi:MAG: cell division protein FtsZ [Calditrichales bacterium]|nr:MAG: cell division protein FtsZ [Calditrichales bacterium]